MDMEDENIYLSKIFKSIDSCNNFVQLKSAYNLIEMFTMKFPLSLKKEAILLFYYEKEFKLSYL
jgi:hypothetical protein